MPKLLVFFRDLRRFGIRFFFEPGGRAVRIRPGALKLQKSISTARATGPETSSSNRRQTNKDRCRQPGARAGLDVAAPAAAVRSEAEDERRSREQSLRAHFLSKGVLRQTDPDAGKADRTPDRQQDGSTIQRRGAPFKFH